MKNNLILVPVFLLLAACAPQIQPSEITSAPPQNAVVGGDKVESNSPVGRSTVGLFGKKIGYICTGTLISENMVLTAGHCVDPEETELTVFFAPEMKKAKASQIRKVIDQRVHRQYTGDTEKPDMADIAVIRFEGTAPEGFQPAPMLFAANVLQNNMSTIVAGYGLNWTVVLKRGSGVLRTTSLTIEDVNFSKTEASITQSSRRGICSGDSGGPAYLEISGRLHVWGVASRSDSLPGILTPKCMILSVFTRVDAYQDFIEESMAQLR